MEWRATYSVNRIESRRCSSATERALAATYLFDELGRWNGEVGPFAVESAPPARTAAKAERYEWQVLFCCPEEACDSEPSQKFLDVNCLTDRSAPEEGGMRQYQVRDVQGREWWLHIAALRIPRYWKGTYRFHPMPDLAGLSQQDMLLAWGAARRSGHTGHAGRHAVWPKAPFSPAAEYAVPDAPEAQLIKAGEVPAIEQGSVVLGGHSRSTFVARFPNGRGILVLLDGEQFFHFGILNELASLSRPPRLVLGLSSTEDPNRRTLLGLEKKIREEVLHWVTLNASDFVAQDGVIGSEPCVLAGASLGGAAALHWGLSRSDLVSGVISLSGSFWLRDSHSNPVWEAASAGSADSSDSTAIWCYLGWGSMEAKLSAGCELCVNQLAERAVQVVTSTWVGGHDFLHWRSQVARGWSVNMAQT